MIFPIVRDDRRYRDPQVNYEQLVVRRNDARWQRKRKEYGFPGEIIA